MRAVAMLFLAGVLVDCGGGNGGARDTDDPPAPAVEAAETGGDETAQRGPPQTHVFPSLFRDR